MFAQNVLLIFHLYITVTSEIKGYKGCTRKRLIMGTAFVFSAIAEILHLVLYSSVLLVCGECIKNIRGRKR